MVDRHIETLSGGWSSSQIHTTMIFLRRREQRDGDGERQRRLFVRVAFQAVGLEFFCLIFVTVSLCMVSLDGCKDAFGLQSELCVDLCAGRAAGLSVGSGVWAALLLRVRGAECRDCGRKCGQRSQHQCAGAGVPHVSDRCWIQEEILRGKSKDWSPVRERENRSRGALRQ